MIIYYRMFTLAMALSTYERGIAVPCDGDSNTSKLQGDEE